MIHFSKLFPVLKYAGFSAQGASGSARIRMGTMRNAICKRSAHPINTQHAEHAGCTQDVATVQNDHRVFLDGIKAYGAFYVWADRFAKL
jgi:hypothetical protein